MADEHSKRKGRNDLTEGDIWLQRLVMYSGRTRAVCHSVRGFRQLVVSFFELVGVYVIMCSVHWDRTKVNTQTLSSCKSLCRQTVNCSGSCCSAVFQRNTLNGKESSHEWGAMNYKVSMWAVSTNENQRAFKGLDWEWAAELLNSRADDEYIHMWTEHVIFSMFQKPMLIEHCF